MEDIKFAMELIELLLLAPKWVWYVVVFAFVLLGAFFGLCWGQARRQLRLMSTTETSPVGEVASRRPDERVEVKGTLRCEAPLVSAVSQQPCAYYAATLEREYENENYGGKQVISSEQVASDEQRVAFLVEDRSGTVRVLPERAEVDAQTVADRYEPLEALGPEILFAGQGYAVGGSKTLGYRFRESVLPVGASVYVLGVVNDQGVIAAPQTGSCEQHFMISQQSEEDLVRSLGKWMLLLAVASIGCIGIGLAVLLLVISWR